MSRRRQSMEDLGFPDPDDIGASEYYAMYECIGDMMDQDDQFDNPSAKREHAISMLAEFGEYAHIHLKRLRTETRNTV